MGMKTSSEPRQVYKRRGVIHVCFAGKQYGPGSFTKIDLDLPVTVEPYKSDGGRARVKVTQRYGGRLTRLHNAHSEIWRTVKI